MYLSSIKAFSLRLLQLQKAHSQNKSHLSFRLNNSNSNHQDQHADHQSVPTSLLTINMPLPTFSCSHQSTHLPPSLIPRYPHSPPIFVPPFLPYPCRSCHHSLCVSAENNIRARHDAPITAFERKIADGDDQIWYKYEPVLYEALKVAKLRLAAMKKERNEEVIDVWGEWKWRWDA